MSVAFHKVLTKIFGSRNERLLKRYRKIVDQIAQLEPEVQQRSDSHLRARTLEIRQGIQSGNIRSADVLVEALAIIRESMDRHIGIREIFNPDQNFDPDQFDDEMLEAYDSVQRQMIQTGQSWQQVEIPANLYAAVRKLYPESRPPFRARPFDVQLIGGLVLYEGKIAEMATGEGKTFVAPLACYMKNLEGFHCHVVTVNDYLVRRDANWIRPAFENLGLSVGYIQAEMEPGGETRRKMYECDVTYGTNSEFGFDYLRDNMKERVDLQVQGPLDFAIVDEVDSILIDEARTPLIISGAAHDDAPKYRAADAVARKMLELNKAWDELDKKVEAAKRAQKAAEGDADKADSKEEKSKAIQRGEAAARQLEELEKQKEGVTQYYEVELDRKSVHLTHEGIAAAQDAAGVGSFYVGNNMEWPHLMEQSLRAHVVYERDKDYVVERGRDGQMEVVIVDEYTGRKMVGRQWSDGLHQAVEAKERVPIKTETQTLATITLQNFFNLYKDLSGMTGTAMTEAEEFTKIYQLEVVNIPTNRPVIRADFEDRVYRTAKEKWDAIIDEIKEESDKGRPVLVGTTSVEKSEFLSNMLKRKYGIEHEVLNAKQHEREASIVAKAGQQHVNHHQETVGNVTIATNMAGRGTDIKPTKEAMEKGGLHVVATERHTSRRIDNQLRGRSGRQGDPGSSRFYVSLEDELMRLFAGEWTIKVLGWLGMEEGMAIEDKRISKGILRAQKKVEERNFLARKNLLDYDEVMNHQRSTFYGMRQQVLEGRDVDRVIWNIIGESIGDAVDKYITQDFVAANVAEWARVNFDVALDPQDYKGYRKYEDIEPFIKDQAKNEATTTITATLGEFTGESTDDRTAWDTKGLQSWAMSRFQVQLSQSQIRQMDYHELEERLRDSAVDQIERRDCAGIMKYLEELYPETELANWAREKFSIEIEPREFIASDKGGRVTRKSPDEIASLIEGKARQAYARREQEYPVDHILTFAFGGDDGNGSGNPYAADFVRQWAQAKYGIDLPLAHLQTTSVKKLREELIGHQKQWLEDGRIAALAEQLVNENPEPEKLADVLRKRYGYVVQSRKLSEGVSSSTAIGNGDAAASKNGDGAPDGQLPPPRELAARAVRGFVRKELSDLEQFVLIQILDQSWKDHLYAMDMLRNSIGLQAFAERDPRVLYKKEGYRYFEEMLMGVRDKTTDLIFRARIQGAAPQARSAYNVTAATHEESGGYGVAENLQAVGAPEGAGGEQHASAGEGGEAAAAAPVKTIVREQEKIGRNDPCPCGSGKKYKKCCGAHAA
ncbi:MAG TPA: SEC-C metal-binding domain-containing protein [Tepidisphaeraceae bacterium]|nr:SEC-C metal-binding domain-containing protein [Tepidisphaeraceae bacterium]